MECVMNKINRFLIFVIIVNIFSVELLAGEYIAERGKRFSLCRDLAANLNTFKNEPPLICGLKFSPKFKDFRFPKWQPLDVNKNMNIFDEILHHKKSRPYTPWIQKLLEQGQVTLGRAMIDFNFDGKKNQVYRMEMKSCQNREEKIIKNIKRGLWRGPDIFIWPYEAVSDSGAFTNFKRSNTPYDLLYYKGRPYLYRWDNVGFGGIAVWETNNFGGKESYSSRWVCLIEYEF